MTEQQSNATEQRTHLPGSLVWNDITTPDTAAARKFYSSLFGWDVSTAPDNEYGMFLHRGKKVAGVGPVMNDNQPARWSTYVLTENAEETAAKVAAAGGEVAVAPTTMGTHGTMASFVDPAGAFLGVWQPGTHQGADQFHSPVSVAWNELHSRDIGASSRFFAAVLGWENESTPFGDIDYTYWKVDGRLVAGGVPLSPTRPAETPSHWFAFFSVPNCDDMVVRARNLGATVLAEPLTSEDGRYSILQDPQGAIFGVISAVAPPNA